MFNNRSQYTCRLAAVAVLLTLVDAAAAADGSLVIAGGGRLPQSVIDEFVQLAGGQQGNLVVIPTASSEVNPETTQKAMDLWRSRGVADVTVLHTDDRTEADSEKFVLPLRQATGVWISGGQQSRLAAAYVGTLVQKELAALVQRGGVIGGTSAGAAIQSGVMIQSGNPVPTISRGLNLVANAVIDQHFLERNRANRLLTAVRRHPELTGIGIDESTAVVLQGSRGKVIGDSFVTLFSVTDGQPLQVRTLRKGAEFTLPETSAEIRPKKWAIVIHGGAGSPPADATSEALEARRSGLREALEKGQRLLKNGGTALEAVEASIRILEDNPLYNAGRGAVFNSAGGHELDASIMDGRTLDGGAVAGVTTVKNPIGLARLVMDKTRHVLLAGAGAEQFATEQKVGRVENQWFDTELRRRGWDKVREKENGKPVSRIESARPWQYGTVGCAVLDSHGNLAAGTSTGGLTNKKFGRVGDSPIIGAGTYADNETCAVSATGIGEQFIRHAVAAQISQLMKHRGWTLKQSAEYVLQKRLNKGDGGVIAVDASGTIEWVYTSPGMFRAAADADGRFDVYIGNEGD